MKTLKGLNSRPEILEENPTKEMIDDTPTFRRLFKIVIGNSLAKSGEQAVDCVQIAMKLRIDADQIELEDAQFKIIKDKVDDNPTKMPAIFQGQMRMLLDKCEKDDKK
jgi:hypothetical protein